MQISFSPWKNKTCIGKHHISTTDFIQLNAQGPVSKKHRKVKIISVLTLRWVLCCDTFGETQF